MSAVRGTSGGSGVSAGMARRFEAVMRAARRRSLAGDQRAGSWARSEARQKQYEFLRRNWAGLLVYTLVVVVVLAIAAVFIPDAFARGLVVGAGLVGAASVMWQWVIQATGTAPVMMGDVGEQWTAQELRKLRSRGWLLVNHVMLTTPDADHVLVGPGGMVAIESKWSAQPWTPGGARLHAAAEQARRNARRLTRWHGLKPVDVGPVGSAVFLWGPGARGLDGPFDLGGTAIVPGHAVPGWRSGLPEGRLTPRQVDAAWQVLDARCRETDPGEARKHPAPLSVGEWLTRAALSLLAACAGYLAVSSVVATGVLWGLGLAWWALMLALGIGVCRIPAVRYLGLAWTGGVIATAVIGAIAIVSWAI